MDGDFYEDSKACYFKVFFCVGGAGGWDPLFCYDFGYGGSIERGRGGCACGSAGTGGVVYFGGVLELSSGGCVAGEAGCFAGSSGSAGDCAQRARGLLGP